MLLNNIALFLQIVEKGSLAAAGREAGLSPTTVSERLSALERHFGVVLLNRTTRALSLTEEGRTLLDGAKQVLGDVAELVQVIRDKEFWRPLNDLKLLRRYERARQADVQAMGLVTDGLQRLFAQPGPVWQNLRNWGMQGVARSGPLKAWLTRQATG